MQITTYQLPKEAPVKKSKKIKTNPSTPQQTVSTNSNVRVIYKLSNEESLHVILANMTVIQYGNVLILCVPTNFQQSTFANQLNEKFQAQCPSLYANFLMSDPTYNYYIVEDIKGEKIDVEDGKTFLWDLCGFKVYTAEIVRDNNGNPLPATLLSPKLQSDNTSIPSSIHSFFSNSEDLSKQNLDGDLNIENLTSIVDYCDIPDKWQNLGR